MRRLARERAAAVNRLEGAERRASAAAAAARRALDRERAAAAARQRARDGALAKLREVEEAWRAWGRTGSRSWPRWSATRRPGPRPPRRAPGPRTRRGRPPRRGPRPSRTRPAWSASPTRRPRDPGDSGLTARAWAAAGRTLPPTSGEQWRTLPKVPTGSLRPGDLVVYFPDAAHVALYVGGGRVVHVPRPGAAVAVSPLAAHPVLGAVRPDAGAPPLAAYVPPDLGGGGA